MDKKDFKERIKLITKIYILMILTMAIPVNILIAFLSSSTIEDFLQSVTSNTISLIIASAGLGTIIFIGFGIGYFLLNARRKRERMLAEQYIRDLPEYFPPAIASFLLDLNLETATDYTATIAYLISNKYVELQENEVIILNNNTENLSMHEKYVLKCISQKEKFDHTKFTKLVMADAEKMNLIKQGQRKVNFFRNFGLAILMFFVFGIMINIFETGFLNEIFSILGLVSEIFVFVIIGYSIYLKSKYLNENFHRTSLGEEEAKKWSGVKKFLKEYTLISEKNLEDIVIWDDYIPYAIALDEAKTIEKYIENNDSYRKLIYGKDKEWWNC